MRSNQSLDRLNAEFEKKSFDIEIIFDKYTQAPGDLSALMNAVMVLLNLDWTVVPKESFQSIKTIAREKANMIQLLKSIDRDSYEIKTVKKLERFTNMDNFYEQHMRGICNEAGILCEWVLALVAYTKDKSIIEPNNQRYSDLISQVKVTQKKLRTTNNQIDGLRIAILQIDRTLQKNTNEM